MSYRIAALSITDYKRLREVEIKPDADRMVILLGGLNANGKSSVLDAIEAALGGKSAVLADPVRHGAGEARIEIKLDGEAPLVVKRKIETDGSSTLELRDDIGAAVRSPQAVLDKIVGARFLDPVAFLGLKPADQRGHLLKLIDSDGKIGALDQRRERVFDLRTEVNRDLKKAAAELERFAAAVEPAAPIDVVDLTKQLETVSTAVNELTAKRGHHERAKEAFTRANDAVKQAEAALEAAKNALKLAKQRRDDADKVMVSAQAELEAAESPAYDASGQRAAIQQQIAQAQEHNRKCAADGATWKRKQEITVEVARLDKRSKDLTAELEKVEADKSTILTSAKLPVPGLGVDGGGVTLNGAPLAQASGAEKLRVALALAIAANPNLRDVWIRDGALLDDASLAAVAEHATKSNVRVWIERVGTRDEGAIIIHDGAIATVSNGTPATQGKLPL